MLTVPGYPGFMVQPRPESALQPQALAYPEAVSRLASIRHALSLVDNGFADGPQSDDAIATAWNEAGDAKQRCFDRRSAKLVGATAFGVETLLTERQEGREPNAAATQALCDQIRRELADVANIILD